MTDLQIMAEVTHLRDTISRCDKLIKDLQKSCPHTDVRKDLVTLEGNKVSTATSYFYECFCNVCLKIWTEPQEPLL